MDYSFDLLSIPIIYIYTYPYPYIHINLYTIFHYYIYARRQAKAVAKASKADKLASGEDTPPPQLANSASQPNLMAPLGGGGSSNISRIRAMSAQGRRNKAKQVYIM